ncbi:hypothetical protein AAHA92_18579 [Salvia divinorum]|uniref:Uncharacterized protein n=1 Tax=Salvia divinorum TaxID=28513 RepID=A0ABD1H5B5_SALDI
MGGRASKPKDMGSRKMPSPAIRKPHAPPEVPVQSPEAPAVEAVPQEKRDRDEKKETSTNLVDVCEPAPKMEPETTEVKPVDEKGVPVEAKPSEEKKEVAETVEVKEVDGIEAPKEKKEEAETHVVPKEDK